MAKLNIYHLFATALVLIHSRRRKREKKLKKKRKAFLDPPLFVHRGISGAYQSLVLKMNEIDKILGLFAYHLIDLTIY